MGNDQPGADPLRWRALIVIAMAQLMVVLDASIVNIALPSMQAALEISDADRQWAVTAYTLTFGGLLLLGGRIADFAGRKRTFMVGLIGFAGASALAGLAQTEIVLFGARALQGAFAALLAPSALSLITVTFTESKERAKAFGVYGALTGGGAALGVIMGGLLTQYASWRWTMWVNVPIALVAFVLASRWVRESRAAGNTTYDIPGAITVTAGLACLVYGITEAEANGWTGSATLSFIAIAVVLLIAFVAIEARSRYPLLPLAILTNRNRAGAYLASFFAGIGILAMFLFLSYFFQAVLHYSPLRSGLLFLPFSLGIIASAALASNLLPRVGPRLLTFIGFVLATAGMLWLIGLTPTSGYLTKVLPALLVISIGMSLIFVPLSATALYEVQSHDAGVASAVLNTSQQIGGTVGIALLNTIAATATAAYAAENGSPANAPAALVHGYSQAFAWGAAILILAAVLWLLLVRVRATDMAEADALPAVTLG